jgi:hypothetical protein
MTLCQQYDKIYENWSTNYLQDNGPSVNFNSNNQYKIIRINLNANIHDPEKTSNDRDYRAEWEQCVAVISKFDNILIDLRKYGFSFVTGIITASSFLGVTIGEKSQILGSQAEVASSIVTMILITVLYYLDTYYQNGLSGSVLRSVFLETFCLKAGLTYYVSKFHAVKLGSMLHVCYFGFLIGSLVLGLTVVIITSDDFKNINWNLIIALGSGFALTAVAMSIMGIYYDNKRYKKFNAVMNLYYFLKSQDCNCQEAYEFMFLLVGTIRAHFYSESINKIYEFLERQKVENNSIIMTVTKIIIKSIKKKSNY